MNAENLAELETNQDPTSVFVRWLGVAVLCLGLYGAVRVALRAWSLLDDPSEVGVFAEKIEKQGHLNAFVAHFDSLLEAINHERELRGEIAPGSSSQQRKTIGNSNGAERSESETMNAAYFAAWGIIVLILALVAKISVWLIGVGGKLALGWNNSERRLKRIIEELVREFRSTSSPTNAK